MILLTSYSERRKALLEQIGFRVARGDQNFSDPVDVVQVDQSVWVDPGSPLNLVDAKNEVIEIAHSRVKNCFATRPPNALGLDESQTVIVGVVTLVFFNGQLRHKPLVVNPRQATPKMKEIAKEKAREWLKDFSNHEFQVLTGLYATIALNRQLLDGRSACIETVVRMKKLSESDIDSYVATGEPLDKAGGFGIQGRGAALFESIQGSYSNVVGLTLVEFVELLRDPLFQNRVQFHFNRPSGQNNEPAFQDNSQLSVVSVGDINLDLIYDQFPEGFFTSLKPPGHHVLDKINRRAGGTAVNFAIKSLRAGFRKASVIGAIGDDKLGEFIRNELREKGISLLVQPDPERNTSIAIVLRDKAEKDTALTLTDADQALEENDAERVRPDVERADVLFVSGYCLTDPKRRVAAKRLMEWAKSAGCLVVLDVTVNMDQALNFTEFLKLTENNVDILVAEVPTILNWFQLKHQYQNDDQILLENDPAFIENQVIPRLRSFFSTLLLRTSTYSHEAISSPILKFRVKKLDYSNRPPDQRLGYGDELTTSHLYEFMSPRILLASASPHRLKLLRQIIANNKIEIKSSNQEETYLESELPEERVKRLALAKALAVYKQGGFNENIQFIIGADTEIVLQNKQGIEEEIRKPSTNDEAQASLKRLSGRTAIAITGLALVHTKEIDPKTGESKKKVESVSTEITFRELSESDIEDYVHSGEPLGKAGAFGIQGKGALLVKTLHGSYSNVVGLPLEKLCDLLAGFGMPIWHLDEVGHWVVPQQPEDFL